MIRIAHRLGAALLGRKLTAVRAMLTGLLIGLAATWGVLPLLRDRSQAVAEVPSTPISGQGAFNPAEHDPDEAAEIMAWGADQDSLAWTIWGPAAAGQGWYRVLEEVTGPGSYTVLHPTGGLAQLDVYMTTPGGPPVVNAETGLEVSSTVFVGKLLGPEGFTGIAGAILGDNRSNEGTEGMLFVSGRLSNSETAWLSARAAPTAQAATAGPLEECLATAESQARLATALAKAAYAACLAAALAAFKLMLAAIGGLAAGAAVFPKIWGPFALFALLTKGKAIMAWIRAQTACTSILAVSLESIRRALNAAQESCKDQFGGA